MIYISYKLNKKNKNNILVLYYLFIFDNLFYVNGVFV